MRVSHAGATHTVPAGATIWLSTHVDSDRWTLVSPTGAFLLDCIEHAETDPAGWDPSQVRRMCRALRNVLVASTSADMQAREAADRGDAERALQLRNEAAAVRNIHTLLAKAFDKHPGYS
ncbi:MAG: hypothetical protein ACRCYU_18655, partial [Nocardioides sp.]